MRIEFSSQTRVGMQIAQLVAEEVANNIAYGRAFGADREHKFVRPVLLGIQNNTFRFETGIVVRLDLLDLNQFKEGPGDRREEWVVTGARVSFYERDASGQSTSEEKVEQVWTHMTLQRLRGLRGWLRQRVVAPESIKGRVCVYWNRAVSDGYVRVDPDRDGNGQYRVVGEVEYSRFVHGDLDRAKAGAHAVLEGLRND